MPLPEPSGKSTRRGPLTFIHDGRGRFPWLARIDAQPGYVYRVGDHSTRRLCYRCVGAVSDLHEGTESIRWDEEPPAEGERCDRCVRSFK